MIPAGSTRINDYVSVYRDDESWAYFIGMFATYRHPCGDLRLFRLTVAQLIDAGCCRPCEIMRTFGVSKSCVMRAVRRYREEGLDGFINPRRGGGKGRVLTEEVLEEAQDLLNAGNPARKVSEELEVTYDTLRKAITDGRLQKPKQARQGTTKSERSVEDAEASEGFGTGCTRVGERMLASLGKLTGATTQFQLSRDVPYGGVLCALPALVQNGLMKGIETCLGSVSGYYTKIQILLLLGFMWLCRIQTLERIRGKAPGEFGKLLGLDRIPEVRCLRAKIKQLSKDDAAEKWSAYLSKQWMNADVDAVGTLYVDGHVRVYHGSQSALPRKYVSRERLCLRGTTDYWVNDSVGRPFFVIDKVVDSGLLQTLENDIVPRLLQYVPNQPDERTLKDNKHMCRFVIVFDREGYSPAFFQRMWTKHRIACITYHKHPDKAWPEDEFVQHDCRMPNGEDVTMTLAERGTLVGTGKNALWMKEVRKLTKQGHQSSLISTAYAVEHTDLATRMFTRWCQENFFQYMMSNFGIDALCDYDFEKLPDTETVVNPAWRTLDRQRNSLQNKLRYRHARFSELTHQDVKEDTPAKYRKWLQKKAEFLEEIEHLEQQLIATKKELKETPHHINWAELDEKDRFEKPALARKRLLDTIKMIAYRAETAMTPILRKNNPAIDLPAARRILQDLFVTEADLIPDQQNKLLTVQIHRSARPVTDRALTSLFEQLNATETCFPGSDMILRYEFVAAQP